MDNDPPPSYKSVVEQDGETRHKDVCRHGSEGPGRSKDLETDTSKLPSTRQSNSDDAGQPEQRPTGLWARFKKSLEDFALFVIQVLD